MVRPVDRNTVLWTLVLFFGASIMFGAIRNATEDEGTGVSLGLQLARRAAAHRRGDPVRETPAVRWLVDGMNVIGSRPTGWWRDRPGAMRALVEELDGVRRAQRRAGDGGARRQAVRAGGRPGVTVQFASRRGPNAADDDIAALVESDPDPADLSVVTSDGDLARRVRDAGATVVGAGEFRRRLDG